MRALAFVLTVSAACTDRAYAQPPGMVEINYGQEWKSWPDAWRLAYLEGFTDGQSDTYWTVFNDLPTTRREPLRIQTFLFRDPVAIRDVMTDLYRDPANTFIRYGAMVYLARDKLSGLDIEPALRAARRNERGYVRRPG